MIPGPYRIIACPHCSFLARQHTLISSNTFGAVLWTDGKQAAPMQPEFPAVAKCRGCRRFYWVNEAKVEGEINFFGDKPKRVPKEWERAEPVEHLTIDEYIEALDIGVGADVQKQCYLRMHFWWAVNDIVRRNSDAQIPTRFGQKLHENLGKLSALFDEHNPNDKLMKAEIVRETGDFAEAVQLLGDVPANYRWVTDVIMAYRKRRTVW